VKLLTVLEGNREVKMIEKLCWCLGVQEQVEKVSGGSVLADPKQILFEECLQMQREGMEGS
jgi:hypothetical protein